MEQIILEKLTGPQLVKKLPAFYGTRQFFSAFTNVCYLSLSWARWIQSMSPSNFLKIHLNIILPSTPGSSKWYLSLKFPHQTLYAPPLSPVRATLGKTTNIKFVIGVFSRHYVENLLYSYSLNHSQNVQESSFF